MTESGQVAGATTIRRINRELMEIQQNPSDQWAVQSVGDNILEWHFTLRGPPGTEFEGGVYHGRLVLPFNYPFAPPSISLLNPSGRFEVNRKICLSISNFHPELWQPAWGVRTIMEALRSFFPTPGDGAIGSLDWPADTRRRLAEESVDWMCPNCGRRNGDILPHVEEVGRVLENSQKTEISVVTPAKPKGEIPPSPVARPAGPPIEAGGKIFSNNFTLNASIAVVLALILAILIDIFVHPVE